MNKQKNEYPMVDIDETKVDIAVRFLNNSNVKETDKEKQEAFLKSKGLSTTEIAVAYQRVSEIELTETDDDSWSIFDYLKGIVLSAGILSAANFAYKAYILPYATRELKDDERMEGLIESFQAVKDDIKQHTYELTGTLKQIQALMEENQKSLTIINSELKKDTTEGSSITELKCELSSIKSMMLSKDQFPATPYTTANQKVNEIPAWQRIADEFNSDKVIEESSVYKTDVDTEEVEGIHVNHNIQSDLRSGQPSVILEEDQSILIPVETEEHADLVNEGLNVDIQIDSIIDTIIVENDTTEMEKTDEEFIIEKHTTEIEMTDEEFIVEQHTTETETTDEEFVVEQHTTETETTDEELSSATHSLESEYSNVDVSQVPITNINETVVSSEQEHEEEEDIPVTTEVNGILYEVVPSVEQLPTDSNNEMFSTEISKEIFLEGTDVVKSEYDLSIPHISESDTEHDTGMDTDVLVQDKVPNKMQDEVSSEDLPDDIVTSELPDDTVAKS